MHVDLISKKMIANSLFILEPNGLATLCLYKSPNTESSIAKGIPATPEMLHVMKKINKILPISIKYRGTRRPGLLGKATCLKKDATSFAVYLR